MKYHSFAEAQSAFAAHLPSLLERGVSFEAGVEPKAYLPEPFRSNSALAMDALPVLSSDPNSAVPAMLTTAIDPQVYEFLFAPLAAVEIYGERRIGNWLLDTYLLPVTEGTGEVTSYGDYAQGGRAGLNFNYPAIQNYLFQLFKRFGEREAERAGLAKLNWVAEIDKQAAQVMNRASNTIYHYGVNGLQNYGLTNNPFLSAALTPSTKAAGGVTWLTSGGAPNAQANEVYNDIVSLVQELINQTNGLAKEDDAMTLVLPNTVMTALNFTNSFNVNVKTLVKENFPKLRIVMDPLFAIKSSTNPTGSSSGNLVQLIVDSLEGQKTGFCAFSEKMRAHRIVPEASSYTQKVTGGAWGTVIRMPMAVAQMVGV